MKTEKKPSVSHTVKDAGKISKLSPKKKMRKTVKSEGKHLAKLMCQKLDLSDTAVTTKQSRSTTKSKSKELAKSMRKKLDLSDATVKTKRSSSKSEREKLAELFGAKVTLSCPKPQTKIQEIVETSIHPVIEENNENTIEQKRKKEKKKLKRKKNKENSSPDDKFAKKMATSKEDPEEQDKDLDDEDQRCDEMAGFCPPPGIVHESLMKERKGKPGKSHPDFDEEEGEIKRGKLERDTSKDHRTVFVGNLPVSTDKKELHKLFKKFGAIDTVRLRCVPRSNTKLPKRAAVILKDFHPERDNICAYVCFREEDSACKALKMNGKLVKNLHIRVDMSNHNPKEDFKRSIFVGNLPLDIKEEDIRTHFGSCGKVRNVRVIRDNKSGVGKGICYVTFKSKDSVSLAMKLKGSEVSGRKVRIEYCLENPRKEKKMKKEVTRPQRKSSKSHKSEKRHAFHTRPSNFKSGANFQTKIRAKQKKKKKSHR